MRSLLLALLLVFASLSPPFPAQAQTGPEARLERVALQLKWKHQFQFAGYYAALEKGFYRDAGLDVVILEGLPGVDPISTLETGAAQFAVHNADALRQYMNGEPVMALAAVFQHSPSMLMVRANSGINAISDLQNRKIMMSRTLEADVWAMLRAEGLDDTDYSVELHDWSLRKLITGEVAAMTAYSTNEPYRMAHLGIPTQSFHPRGHGIDFYGDLLLTSQREYRARPQRAERFTRASLKGWSYAMEHPGEIVDLILKKYDPNGSRDKLFNEAEGMRTLIQPQLVEIGTMSRARWQQIADIYASLDMVPHGVSLSPFLPPEKKYSTDDFIKMALWAGAAFILLGIGAMALYAFNRRLSRHSRETERIMDSILSVSPYSLILCRERIIIWANPATTQMFGHDQTALQGMPTRNLYDDEGQYELIGRAVDESLRTGREIHQDVTMCHKNGDEVVVQLSVRFIDVAAPDKGYIVSLVDIAERKRAEVGLRQAAQVFEQSRDSVVITDPEGIIVDCNQAYTEITGYSREEALGTTPRALKSGRHDNDFYIQMWRAISKNGIWSGEIWNRKKDGELFPAWLRITAVKDAEGRIVNYVGTISDLTAEKQSAESIYRLNNYDLLTGLPNRALMLNLLEQELTHAREDNEGAAVIILDLDNFKAVNESMGIASGDELLTETANRLSGLKKSGYTAARLGSDEFALLLTGVSGTESIAPVVQTVQDLISQPFNLSAGEAVLTCSMGVSVFPDDAGTAEDLVQNAENALHHALQQGTGSYEFFSPGMTERASERLKVGTALRGAIERGEFELHYQPKVDFITRRTVGAEALIRWRHPEWGLVFPDRFIPLVEETDLVHGVGEWVMLEACRATRRLHEAGFKEFRMAVNVSPRQFLEKDMCEVVGEILVMTGLEARFLELEITEALLVKDVDRVRESLNDLKQLGVRLAIDDFGTGYSSLSYLTSFPLDTLKIDRSFITTMEFDARNAAITSTVVAMSKTLGLDVVAEGVENHTHESMLRDLGCDIAQGYLFSRPLPEGEFLELIRAARWPSDDEDDTPSS